MVECEEDTVTWSSVRRKLLGSLGTFRVRPCLGWCRGGIYERAMVTIRKHET
jgi:hypothetical protein